jgi:hypothetical protein
MTDPPAANEAVVHLALVPLVLVLALVRPRPAVQPRAAAPPAAPWARSGTAGGGRGGVSGCHFRDTATEYDSKPGMKWLSCTAK